MRTLFLLPIFLLCSAAFASDVRFIYHDIYSAEPLDDAYTGWSTMAVAKSFGVDWSRTQYGEHKGKPFIEVPLEKGKAERTIGIKTAKGIFYSKILLVGSPMHVEAPFDFLVALVEAGKAGREMQCQIAAYSAEKSADAKGPIVLQRVHEHMLGQPIECRYR